MAHPVHHFSLHITKAKKKRLTKTVDGMVYFIGFFGNAAVVPQIILAWGSEAPGLAISTWLLFVLIGLIWLLYAILHNQKPLIFAQVVGLTANMLVVSGWAVNNLLM